MIVSDTSCKIHLVIINPTWIKGRKKGSCWLQMEHCECLFKTFEVSSSPPGFADGQRRRRPCPAAARPLSLRVLIRLILNFCPVRPDRTVRDALASSRRRFQVPGPVVNLNRVTVAESRSLSQSRNSDNEYFASVFKLARFCSPGGLRRPCPTAALPPGRRVTVGADCAGPAPSPPAAGPAPPTLNKWQSTASPRAAAADALAAGR